MNKTMVDEDESEFAFQLQVKKGDMRDPYAIGQLMKSVGCVVVTKSSEKGLFWVLFETIENPKFIDLSAPEFRTQLLKEFKGEFKSVRLQKEADRFSANHFHKIR